MRCWYQKVYLIFPSLIFTDWKCIYHCKIHRFKISRAKLQILRYLCMTFLYLQFTLTACNSTTCTLPPLQYNDLILSGIQTLNNVIPALLTMKPTPHLICIVVRIFLGFAVSSAEWSKDFANKSYQDAFANFNLGW